MITNDQELAVTQQRVVEFQDLLLQLRKHERPENYPLMASAYLLDIDKMNEDIRCYLAHPPTQQATAVR